MSKTHVFEEYHSRLVREGVLKALILGLIVGFAAMFAAAFVTWFLPVNGLWISLAAFAGATLIFTPVFYFRFFRPTAKDIARRIDSLGLEERLITMLELEKDESYIALRQREDAKEKLSTVDRKQIRFSLSRKVKIVLSVSAALGIAMFLVTSLSAFGILPDGGDVIVPGDDRRLLSISYLVEEGGFIDGDEEQLVFSGEDASPVIAVAEEGYMFDSWDDGSTNPYRQEKKVSGEMIFTAIFVRVEDGDDPGMGDEPSDSPTDAPGDESSQQRDPNNDPGSPGGRYEDHNQVIDGETYYRDVLQEYYDRAMEILSEGGEIPPELREVIEAYFNIIL